MAKRAGTNATDRVNIKEYLDAGVRDPHLIAANLNLEPGPVAGCMSTMLGEKITLPEKAEAEAKDDRIAELERQLAAREAEAAGDAPDAEDDEDDLDDPEYDAA